MSKTDDLLNKVLDDLEAIKFLLAENRTNSNENLIGDFTPQLKEKLQEFLNILNAWKNQTSGEIIRLEKTFQDSIAKISTFNASKNINDTELNEIKELISQIPKQKIIPVWKQNLKLYSQTAIAMALMVTLLYFILNSLGLENENKSLNAENYHMRSFLKNDSVALKNYRNHIDTITFQYETH